MSVPVRSRLRVLGGGEARASPFVFGGYQLARNFVLLLMRLLAYACKPAVVNHISIGLRHSRQLGEISQSAMLTLMAVARIHGVYA